MGTRKPPATCAAVRDAPEQPAPMIALTPWPENASLVRCKAPVKLSVPSHFESRYAKRRSVVGNKWSEIPSVLLLISRSA
eukprot:7390034-Prymnesium_polylepis.2